MNQISKNSQTPDPLNPRPSLAKKQAHPPVLSRIERQFFRLQNYFNPYPQFILRADSSKKPKGKIPLRIREVTSKTKKFSAKRYLVKVYEPLILESKEEWIEAAILSVAKDFIQESSLSQFDEENFYNNSTECQKLVKHAQYLDSIKLQEQEEVARSLGKKALCGLWKSIRMQYFPEREDLDQYQVVWSGRKQTSSLASCNVGRKRILVAPAMKNAESLPYLEALLYHEMCHAFLGEPPIVNGRRIMHGKDFKALERLHPGIPELDEWIKSGGWNKVANSKIEPEQS